MGRSEGEARTSSCLYSDGVEGGSGIERTGEGRGWGDREVDWGRMGLYLDQESRFLTARMLSRPANRARLIDSNTCISTAQDDIDPSSWDFFDRVPRG